MRGVFEGGREVLTIRHRNELSFECTLHDRYDQASACALHAFLTFEQGLYTAEVIRLVNADMSSMIRGQYLLRDDSERNVISEVKCLVDCHIWKKKCYVSV